MKNTIEKRKKSYQIFLSILLIFILTSVKLISQDLSISTAHQLLQNKEYEKAIEIYSQLIVDGKSGKALYYNLGICHYELEQNANAILNFERALKLDPHNSAIQHNLKLANRRSDQNIIPLEDFFLTRWWNSFSSFFTLGTWTLFLFITLLLLIASFYFYTLSSNGKWSNLGKKVFYPLLPITLIILLAGFNKYRLITESNTAILMKVQNLYSGPDIRSDSLYQLQEGSKVYLLDSLNGWFKVELINKESGWINNENLEEI